MKKEHFLSRLNVLRKEASASFNYDQVPDEFDQADSIPIECLTHGVFYQKPIRHLYGGKCPECVLETKRQLLVDRNSITTEDFILKSKKKFKDRFNYSKTVYKGKCESLTITCLKHGDFETPAYQHFKYHFGCPTCSKEIPLIKKTEQRIDKARKIHQNRYNYSRVIPCTDTNKVEIICPKHGSFWQKPNSHTSSKYGCKLCNDSKGEVKISLILKKHGINYIREYKIDHYHYRYDFFLPDFNTFIEFNGIQHYQEVKFFGGSKGFKSTKKRDKKKKELIKKQNGILITLSYLDLESNVDFETLLLNKLKRIGINV